MMKNKVLKNGFLIPELGMGTWPMGGYRIHNKDNDDQKDIDAIRYAIKLGITHFDTAEMYASGYAEKILGRAICESNKADL